MTEISHRATRPASSPAAVLERTPEDAGKALTQRLMRPKLLAVLTACSLLAWAGLGRDLATPVAAETVACPRERAAVERRGVRFATERPVLRGDVCDEAVDAVDAGFCVRSGGQLRCLPSFIIAGAQKAATGWLRQRLQRHPELAQGGDRELHYFDRLDAGALPRWHADYLVSFASPSAAHVTYEKTPDYMPNATAMASIRRLLPSVKLIFLLRAPTGRAYSAYQHHCRRGRLGVAQGSRAPIFELEASAVAWRRATPLPAPCSANSFDLFLTNGSAPRAVRASASRVVTWGLYAAQLRQIRALGFADEQLLVIFSEPAMQSSAELLGAVVRWLGLSAFDFASLRTFTDALGREQLVEPGARGAAQRVYAQYNYAMVAKHTAQPLSEHTRTLLDDHFRQPNRDLEDLLTRAAPNIAVYPPRTPRAALIPPSWSS